ncbi:MAG: hypothetical protein RLZZ293_625 [Pseudomonadota bacterium]|jgi:hypothetical protein
MKVKMKKFLLPVLATSLINSIFANNRTGIHFTNYTTSSIYLISQYTKNGESCKGKTHGVVEVKSGRKYNFSIAHNTTNGKVCDVSLLGYTNNDLSESTIALQEKFRISPRYSVDGSYQTSHVSSHQTPPSICGIGMKCSTHLTNGATSLYIKITDKNNQYAHITFTNNKQKIYYVRFLNVRGGCYDYLDKSWFKVLPGETKIDYIINYQKGKTCDYEVRVAQDETGVNLSCSTFLTVHNDFNNNNTIKAAYGDCNTTVSNNNWLASIELH